MSRPEDSRPSILSPNTGPRMTDYFTLHNIALVTFSITAAALAGKGVLKAIEITTDTQQDIQAFRVDFFKRTEAAAAQGALSDFKMPIILRHQALERAMALFLSSFNTAHTVDLGDLLKHYGVSSATAWPFRERIGSTDSDQLWIRMLTNPRPVVGERKRHYEIVGFGCRFDAPSPPFPIRGALLE
jgi:hypothetical protein